jgi:hypothetical protein
MIIILILVNIFLNKVINDIKDNWNDPKYEIIKNEFENELECCGLDKVNNTNYAYNYSHNDIKSCECQFCSATQKLFRIKMRNFLLFLRYNK